MTKSKGIGFKGGLPWKCKEELKLFKEKTMNGILIVGKNTATSLPDLKGRQVVVLSRQDDLIKIQNMCTSPILSVHDSLDKSLKEYKGEHVFVSGGSQIYNEVFQKWKNQIRNVHMSIMNDSYECDSFVDFDFDQWTVQEKTEYKEFTHYILKPIVSEESQYLELVKDVYNNGCIKDGRNGETLSQFGKSISFDLRKGFPLLTTKKMFFRGIVEELLFFIRGQTNSKLLEQKRINIWKGNTSRAFLDSNGFTYRKEGVLGPMYGYQWRYFNSLYDEEDIGPKHQTGGIDQLKNIVHMIQTNPHSRRIMMTDFNPLQVDQGVLPPCHSIIIQFYVSSCNRYLDMFCYNRSSDLFHGLPFNISSSALFHTFISKIANKIPRKLMISLGDVHIYNSHYKVVEQQLERIPFTFPQVNILKELNTVEDLENLEYKDIRLENYVCYPPIKADMVC